MSAGLLPEPKQKPYKFKETKNEKCKRRFEGESGDA